ncbi:SAM-dependent methyltransferase [cf. Phormidesmis sp. LEGE 11477]|uniref:SAM-dependent methyltransferase n=1 Tax=cf. Phormidesmis sp. LEGE 11477 TaxID=1828680 RepID=UPI00187E4F42|nr:SAM-dependent methyltransferase [cf. Phormidesmis sp. LEGE 11477]MBE9059439.1 SAM-dependent methyltransferase [cf. Phormidesmis sp. LEGE 11477]
MTMRLDQVVPFGRSFDEYVRMFALDAVDLGRSILGVADGPASFNAEGSAKGIRIQSCDPLYAFGADEIRDRFYAVIDNIITQIENTPNNWVWSYHKSAADLRKNRIKVTERFYADYETGKAAGRYLFGELPNLSYEANSFSLSLCSHFLFLYSAQLDLEFHLKAITEMLRISQEARLFPLLTLDQKKSPHLLPVVGHFQSRGYQCEIEKVAYELQPGGNEMLKISRL